MVAFRAAPGSSPSIAYFSMEIALDEAIPTYAGGLGVLAGDSLRAAADLGLPMLGVTLLHRKGYIRQHLDGTGRQSETTFDWSPEDLLELMPARAAITLDDRTVHIQAWRYVVQGVTGAHVPVYLLDTALPENDPKDRSLVDRLYGGDNEYRLRQEVILGIGGIAMLRALGHTHLQTYHMNEGHSSLLTIALLEETRQSDCPLRDSDLAGVRARCVFTTHTPVSAGHDKYPLSLLSTTLGDERGEMLYRILSPADHVINLTSLALVLSRRTNAVSQRHARVSHIMFPEHPISAITNGVHAPTWVSPPFARLYDDQVPGWRQDNNLLRGATHITLDRIQAAHAEAKQALLAEVKRRSGISLDPAALTIGSARRAAGYKRADLLFSDADRLKGIVRELGPLQVIFGGKAHPRDERGKGAIQRIFAAAQELKDHLRVIYLEDYDMSLAKVLVTGADLWLNTPTKPMEASGTSGMKAALNGIPSLSVLDGWWLEGCEEGVTGWAIGDDSEESKPDAEIESLYSKLELTILPMFYQRPQDYAAVMRSTIARNGPRFAAQRMTQQYAEQAYEISLPVP